MKSIECVVETEHLDIVKKAEKKINKKLSKMELSIDSSGYNLLTGQRDFVVYLEDDQEDHAKAAKKVIKKILKKFGIKPKLLEIRKVKV